MLGHKIVGHGAVFDTSGWAAGLALEAQPMGVLAYGCTIYTEPAGYLADAVCDEEGG